MIPSVVPVQGDDMERLRDEADDSRYCAIVLSAVDELKRLRLVADAAAKYMNATPSNFSERGKELADLLRSVGR